MDELFKDYRKLSGIIYPPFSKLPYESFFYSFLQNHPLKETLSENYLPIFWTETYLKHHNNSDLENKLISIDSNKHYFTIIQHDDGIKNNIPPNTTIYSMGTNKGKLIKTGKYIPIPLTYYNPELFNLYSLKPKDIFVSFIGSITHNCRKLMYNHFFLKPKTFLNIKKWSNNIDKLRQDQFLEITSRSIFTLAPRGYGITSFRLYEALNLGSIPVYISDIFWLPFQDKIDWNKLAILCPINQIPTLYNRLKSISTEQINNMLEYYKSVSYLFTYEGISNYIIEHES